MKNLYTIIIVVILGGYGGHTVLADCTGDAPVAWLNVYWENDPGNYEDIISYHAYVVDGDYRLAVTDVGDWWDGRISSIECFDSYPAYWWIYDHPECDTYMTEGEGSENLSGGNNDDLGSLKFRCPSDKDRTWFTFCEHHDCDGKAHQIKLYKHGNSDEVVWEIRLLDGHWNDKISAIESGINGTLPKAHAYWYFYKHKDFENSNGKKHPPDRDLKDNDEDWDLGEMDNQITSFRLVITDDDTPPTIQSQLIPGDINYDGIVDIFDLTHLADSWLKQDCDWCGSGGDLNTDYQVDLFDLAVLADHWFETLPVY